MSTPGQTTTSTSADIVEGLMASVTVAAAQLQAEAIRAEPNLTKIAALSAAIADAVGAATAAASITAVAA